jgi:Tol biopolymer transport system component
MTLSRIIMLPSRLIVSLLGFVALAASIQAQSSATERVSLRSTGAQAVQPSQAPSVSADGRWVAFHSDDPSMVPGDTNGVRDVFLRDVLLGTTTRVSVATGGAEGNGDSSNPDVSDDGRYIAFHSAATNLIPNDHNGLLDVFLHDRVLGTTIRVSITNLGFETIGGDSVGGVVSADGEYVAFRSAATNIPLNPDTNGVSDIFRWDRSLGSVRRISVATTGEEPNQESIGASISATGRYVVFFTKADNLLPPLQDSNGAYDVYVRDVFTATTELVSKSTAGVIGNADSSECSISADGRYVAFRSAATDLIPGDTNGVSDVFVRDLQSNTTERISVPTSGAEANGGSVAPAISEDGRYVAFESSATNLIGGDTNGKKDVFLRDVLLGVTSRVSVSTSGGQADRQSVDPAISNDGRYVVFESTATNLVQGDTNLAADVFRRDRGDPALQLAKSGTCPGTMTLTITNATPNENVAIAYGPAGSFTLGIPPCAGLMLDISSPTLGAIRSADAVGEAALVFTVGGGACGVTVQAVDIQTCRKSGAVTL